jgi:hypothetical protein
MTVRVYKSTDASAPVLSGTVGTLITVLDAILVNGYGALAAAGWSKPYSATNKAVYRMATSGNTGFYLNVQDSGPGAGGAREARVWGYEAATAQDTGTNPFPTVAQFATGLFLRKSTTADSTARAWYCVADTSCFYFFVDTGDFTAPAYSFCFAFGDIFSYKASDAYRCMIIARDAENTGSANNERLGGIISAAGTWITTLNVGHFLARSWTGIGGALQFGKHATQQAVARIDVGEYPMGGSSAQVTYPNGADSALLLSPVWVHHSSCIRGYMKGLWAPCHSQPLGHGDTFSGTGNMSGKSFLALNIKTFGGNNGQLVVETSDTWT